MLFQLRKLLFILTFNFSLLLLLMIGIQNSSSKRKVNLIVNETVRIPVSFIIGISFISGSLTGSFLTIKRSNKN